MSEQVIATPIKPIIPAVFVYVTNLKKSTEWYCKLLGLPHPVITRDDIHIFVLSDSHCSNIFLKKRDEVNPTSEAIFSLTSPDNEATFQFLTELGIEITHWNQDVVYFKDPDGNVLMACSI
jgi:catechol 2,3-dioxygenase-like lactoylglutathione lyase family enzyme